MNGLGNTLEDLLSPEELDLYNNPIYPFNLDVLHKALKAKLEEEPDYEVWVPLVYYKFEPFLKTSSGSEVRPYKYFISNKARIGSLRGPEAIIVNQWVNSRYVVCNLPLAKGEWCRRVTVHRILGCSFVPLGDLAMHHPKDLQVNHLDGDKLNLELDNLEWATPSGNTCHAVANGLAVRASGEKNSRTKPAKGTILRGPNAGFEFILSGRKEQMALGFLQTSINRCCLGVIGEHKHCSWSFATDEELAQIDKGIPPEILADLMAMKPAPKRPSR